MSTFTETLSISRESYDRIHPYVAPDTKREPGGTSHLGENEREDVGFVVFDNGFRMDLVVRGARWENDGTNAATVEITLFDVLGNEEDEDTGFDDVIGSFSLEDDDGNEYTMNVVIE